MTFDATFWTFVGLILFLALIIYLKVPQKVLSSLDDHSRAVRDELEEARRLREEAQDVLASFKRKLEEADQEVEKIITGAKRTAETLVQEAEVKAKQQIERKELQIKQRMEQAEADAVAEVRSVAVDAAVDAVETMMQSNMKSAIANKLIADGIAEVNRSS